MDKQAIIRKLTSRKMWIAICEFVSMLLVALGHPESVAVQVAALIMAGAGAIAYIVAEGFADASNASVIAEGIPIIDDAAVIE